MRQDGSATSWDALNMRGFRFRTFGVAGSVTELLVGIYLLQGVLWTDEKYDISLVAGTAVPSTLIAAAGLYGLVVAARRRDADRSARD